MVGELYKCDRCGKNKNDLGPYETTDGDYICQSCMESQVEAAYERICEERFVIKRTEKDREDDGMCPDCGDSGDCPKCFSKTESYS